MSIATALLLVGAVAIMLIMHFVGHGGHGDAHGAHEAQDADDPSAATREDVASGDQRPATKRHGCC
jgi:hypothetical protein